MARSNTLAVLLVAIGLLVVACSLHAQVTLAFAVNYPEGQIATRTCSADFDGDGDMDLVTTRAHSLSLFGSDGTGAFGPRVILTAGFAKWSEGMAHYLWNEEETHE